MRTPRNDKKKKKTRPETNEQMTKMTKAKIRTNRLAENQE